VVTDNAINLNNRKNILLKNGAMGIVLVLIFLSLFLNTRLAYWVALGLPISFLGMFIFAAYFNITLNLVSLFGMIIVIGILVDDGIVIAENIYQHYEKGKPRIQAAIDGTMEVLPAIVSAVITTVLAFSTILYLEGRIGDIFREVSIIVILTLLVSLIEALLILPAHIAHSKALVKITKKEEKKSRGIDKIFLILRKYSRHRRDLDEGAAHVANSVARWLSPWVAAIAAVFVHAAIAQPTSERYQLDRLVPPSEFHGVHGLAFDAHGVLYAGSVVGHSIYRVDTATGAVNSFVGAPDGMADDLVFLADGTVVWTSIQHGVVRARKGDGPIRKLADLVSVNSIDVRKDGRLFVAQVFGGDALWELDPAGAKPPRLILKDLGGFNGFDVGPDGRLYGPLWFKQQVVRIDPDTSKLEVVADGFHTPAAANFDSKWNLYVLDTARGEVVRVDIGNGKKQVVARLATALDNLAIDSRDRVFVSNMADNGIQEVDVNKGTARQVVKGALAIPLGIAAVADGTRDTLYVADVFSLRTVDSAQGKVTDVARSHAADTPIGYPVAVTANRRHVVVTNNEGPVQRYDRGTMRLVQSWRDTHAGNAIEMPSGALIIAETTRGKLSKITGSGARELRSEIVVDLAAPLGLAIAGDSAVYVSEMAAGRVSRSDVSSGARRVIAEGRGRPQGSATDGSAGLVGEAGKGRRVRIEPGSSAVEVIARDLPIGLANVPITLAGVAVGAGGTIYVTSDVENSIWRLKKK
jgi:sugar lactone lactonase YvrE